MPTELEILGRGIETLDLFDRVVIGKAPQPSPLTQVGFLRGVIETFRLYLEDVDGAMDSPKIRRTLARITSTDWEAATLKARAEAIQQLEDLVSDLPKVFGPAVASTTTARARTIFTRTNRALAARHAAVKLVAGFGSNSRANRAARAMKSSGSIFTQNVYSQAGKRMGKVGQDIVAAGLKRGAGRREIGRLLESAFRDQGRRASYWETVAAVHTNRSRAFATIWSYADSGIEKYEVLAVRDERTTEVCQFMDGKVFTVQHAMERFTAFEEDADDLNGVRAAWPFMRAREDQVRMIQPDGSTGRRVDDLGEQGLAGLGFATPPYHFRCRTTMIPIA